MTDDDCSHRVPVIAPPLGRRPPEGDESSRYAGSFTCPLCGLADDRFEAIYRHLLSTHRESSLADALIESTTPEDPAREAKRSAERNPHVGSP